jgi:hypothetical protein
MFYGSKPFENGWQLVHKAAFLCCIPTEIKKIPSLESPEDLGFAVSSDGQDSPPGSSTVLATLKTLKIRVQFAGVKPEVPPDRRRAGIKTFRGRITWSDIPFHKPLGAVTYATKDTSASFPLTYDPTQISKEEVKAKVSKQSKTVQWQGKVKLYFS